MRHERYALFTLGFPAAASNYGLSQSICINTLTHSSIGTPSHAQSTRKSEILNPKQIQNYKFKCPKRRFEFRALNLDIVSYFDIRASNFLVLCTSSDSL